MQGKQQLTLPCRLDRLASGPGVDSLVLVDILVDLLFRAQLSGSLASITWGRKILEVFVFTCCWVDSCFPKSTKGLNVEIGKGTEAPSRTVIHDYKHLPVLAPKCLRRVTIALGLQAPSSLLGTASLPNLIWEVKVAWSLQSMIVHLWLPSIWLELILGFDERHIRWHKAG